MGVEMGDDQPGRGDTGVWWYTATNVTGGTGFRRALPNKGNEG